MISLELYKLAESLGQQLLNRSMKITTAESCTGGGLSFAITGAPGSSAWFQEGFVTYSNRAKSELLGVSESILSKYGAVSSETARAMAEGAKNRAHADFAISITGIAGPNGGTSEKPVGLVWFGFYTSSLALTKKQIFSGDRAGIRSQAIQYALELAIELTN